MLYARLIPMLSGALRLANAGSAEAESIATGCLAKNGNIYAVNPYSNNPLAACRKGDQLIRFALHQPDTKFSKQRAVIPFESGQQMASFQYRIPMALGHSPLWQATIPWALAATMAPRRQTPASCTYLKTKSFIC
jgi:hypothetical protein